MTKLVFMGTPAFSATVLEGLLTDERYDIVAVVTQPDRAVGRKKEIRMTPVKEVALAHDLPIYQPEKLSGLKKWHNLCHLVLMELLLRLMDNSCQASCLIAWILQ